MTAEIGLPVCQAVISFGEGTLCRRGRSARPDPPASSNISVDPTPSAMRSSARCSEAALRDGQLDLARALDGRTTQPPRIERVRLDCNEARIEDGARRCAARPTSTRHRADDARARFAARRTSVRGTDDHLVTVGVGGRETAARPVPRSRVALVTPPERAERLDLEHRRALAGERSSTRHATNPPIRTVARPTPPRLRNIPRSSSAMMRVRSWWASRMLS